MEDFVFSDGGFISFRCGTSYFLIPLGDVVRIEAAAPDGMDTVRLTPDCSPACVITVNDDGFIYALACDDIEGLANVPSHHQYELPEAVSGGANGWLSCVSLYKGRLYYLVDCALCRKHFITEAQR